MAPRLTVSTTQFFACPGRDMPEPEGIVYCYRAGHACPPARPYQVEDDYFVKTTWRCPCCGDFHSQIAIPKSWGDAS